MAGICGGGEVMDCLSDENYFAWMKRAVEPAPIPEGAMRVAPGSDAVVWKVSPEHSGEL